MPTSEFDTDPERVLLRVARGLKAQLHWRLHVTVQTRLSKISKAKERYVFCSIGPGWIILLLYELRMCSSEIKLSEGKTCCFLYIYLAWSNDTRPCWCITKCLKVRQQLCYITYIYVKLLLLSYLTHGVITIIRHTHSYTLPTFWVDNEFRPREGLWLFIESFSHPYHAVLISVQSLSLSSFL